MRSDLIQATNKQGLRISTAVVAFLVALVAALSNVTMASATGSIPQATWDSVTQACASSPPPLGAMAWDGSHIWAPLGGSTIAEVNPTSNAYSCWSPLSLATNYGGFGTLTANPGIAFADGSVWATGQDSGSLPYLIRIDPSASGGPVVTGEWQITNSATYINQIVFDGSSLWIQAAAGVLFRVDPISTGDPTIVSIAGGIPNISAEAFDGTHLWLSYGIGSLYGLAEYAVNSATTVLPVPIVTSTAVSDVWSMSADSTHLWLLSGAGLDELNLSDGSAVNLGLNDGPAPLMVAADGTYTWVAGGATSPGSLTGVLASNPTASTTIALVLPPPTRQGAASGVLFDGTNVWAAENQDGTIERLLAYPTAPVITGATEQANGDATLTWTPPLASGNAPISNYVVGISPSVGITTSPPTSGSVIFHGLAAGVTYTLRVQASNGPYDGPWATTTVTLAALPMPAVPTVNELATTGSPVGVLLGVSSVLLYSGRMLMRRRPTDT